MPAVVAADVLEQLHAGAHAADSLPDWPTASLTSLGEADVFRWSIPKEYGGLGLSLREQLEGSEVIAGACLTTSFILSQREAAVRRILAGPAPVRERYLPEAAAGRLFLTVGLSQLTTSRVHLGPALRATPTDDDGYRLTGDIPWVTGADQAGVIIVGATLPDDQQVLIALPADSPGVAISTPMPLAALTGSRTAAIRCDDVTVSREAVLAGPTPHVLGKVGGGGLETSCLALGMAAAATGFLRREAEHRPDMVPVAGQFETAVGVARRRLHALAEGSPDPEAALALRVECTRLALNATQTGLLSAKGTGFVVPHPAQRWARQALFFLIWSCPRPVAAGVLDGLLPAHPLA